MLKFEQPSGKRVHRYFLSVCTEFDSSDQTLWWYSHRRKWAERGTYPGENCSTHANCRTVKAFKRMLRKHPILNGRARLCSRYDGYDVLSVPES